MARSLEAARIARVGRIAPADHCDIRDFLEREADALGIDPSYGEALRPLLPRRLGDFFRPHTRAA